MSSVDLYVNYEVTRLPGAPQRRAGLVWPEGSELVSLSDEQVRQIAADPGYRIVAADLVLEATIGQGKSAGVEALVQETAPKPSRRKRPG
jgi:hypothetical protein